MRRFIRKSKRAGYTYADDSCCIAIVVIVIVIVAIAYMFAVASDKNNYDARTLIIDRLLAKGDTEVTYIVPLVKYDFIFEGVQVRVDGSYTTLTGPAKRIAEILAIIYDVDLKANQDSSPTQLEKQ